MSRMSKRIFVEVAANEFLSSQLDEPTGAASKTFVETNLKTRSVLKNLDTRMNKGTVELKEKVSCRRFCHGPLLHRNKTKRYYSCQA